MNQTQAAAIRGITLDPRWEVLADYFKAGLEKEKAQQGNAILRGGAEIDPLVIERRRGYWDGVESVIQVADKAKAILRDQNRETE